MPTYEYRCPECGNEFEKFGKMSDPPVTACTRCGAEAQRRISAGAGLVFKGSGFYITDYKRAGQGDKAGGGEGKGDGKSEPKGDSAPARPDGSSSAPSSSGGSGSTGGAAKGE